MDEWDVSIDGMRSLEQMVEEVVVRRRGCEDVCDESINGRGCLRG